MTETTLLEEVEQLRMDCQRKKRHLELMTDLAMAAAETSDLGILMPLSIELIALANNWVIGQYWAVSEKDDLASCTEWHFMGASLSEFRSASIDRHFSKGVGLPGRVWASCRAVQLTDLAQESAVNFPRCEVAAQSGLVSAYAFPVHHGPHVTGVLEFFHTENIELTRDDDEFYMVLGDYLSALMANRHN